MELVEPPGNASNCHIWPVFVGVQSLGGRIETRTELDS